MNKMNVVFYYYNYHFYLFIDQIEVTESHSPEWKTMPERTHGTRSVKFIRFKKWTKMGDSVKSVLNHCFSRCLWSIFNEVYSLCNSVKTISKRVSSGCPFSAWHTSTQIIPVLIIPETTGSGRSFMFDYLEWRMRNRPVGIINFVRSQTPSKWCL